MPKSITEILNDEVLSEEVKVELTEAFEARIAEQREEILNEVNENSAERYENDKTQIVEAMDTMLKDVLKQELDEFSSDKKRASKEHDFRMKELKEHAKNLEFRVERILKKEIDQLAKNKKRLFVDKKRHINEVNEHVRNLDTQIKDILEREIGEFSKSKVRNINEQQDYMNKVNNHVKKLDRTLHNVLKTEIGKLSELKLHNKQVTKENVAMLEDFINNVLTEEISSLHKDRKRYKDNLRKLEGFVISQLTEEIGEFRDDRRSLLEQKVKMVRKGKAVIENARKSFIRKSAIKLENVITDVLTNELSTMREDIQIAKENNFGRKIFEVFANEFMSSTLSESTQVSKLVKKITGLKKMINKTNAELDRKNKALVETRRDARVQKEMSRREMIMSEILGPLNSSQRETMRTLLETTNTSNLKSVYKKYLPIVLSESSESITPVTKKVSLTEKRKTSQPSFRQRVVEGNRNNTGVQREVDTTADIINLRRLAGLS